MESSRSHPPCLVWNSLFLWTTASIVSFADALAVTSGCNSSLKPVITFVTGNPKKLEEVQLLLGGESLPFRINHKTIDLPELQGDDAVDICKEKCRLAAKQVKGPVLVEDTCLCFNALGGLPGPYIKWFLNKCGLDGLNKMLVGFADKTAYAQTIVVLSVGSKEHVFEGRTEGTIVSPRGTVRFGWDPIFQPSEGKGDKTYAEMTLEEKNVISHRGRAFGKLKTYLMEHADDILAEMS